MAAAVFNKHVSKLSTLKWAAAADSVSKNAWCDGATRVSSPSMIMAVVGGPGAVPPIQFSFYVSLWDKIDVIQYPDNIEKERKKKRTK